jgi:ribonuclease BN (tRNA processing enzyme)
MKLKVLGCYGGSVPGRGMTSFLVNGTVALDAGFVSGALTLREQVKVKDIAISHAHLDHTCSLPFLIDNNFAEPGFALRIHAIPEVIASMRAHLFNNHTWPDFTSLPNDLSPVLKFVPIENEEPFRINGVTLRAIRVSHNVPTTGFVVEDAKAALGFTSDTGPTERFWEVVNKIPRLRAIITEASFPNEEQELADVAGHLTPRSLALELQKLERDVPVYLYGAKPRFLDTIRREVSKLKRKKLYFLVQGRTYSL